MAPCFPSGRSFLVSLGAWPERRASGCRLCRSFLRSRSSGDRPADGDRLQPIVTARANPARTKGRQGRVRHRPALWAPSPHQPSPIGRGPIRTKPGWGWRGLGRYVPLPLGVPRQKSPLVVAGQENSEVAPGWQNPPWGRKTLGGPVERWPKRVSQTGAFLHNGPGESDGANRQRPFGAAPAHRLPLADPECRTPRAEAPNSVAVGSPDAASTC